MNRLITKLFLYNYNININLLKYYINFLILYKKFEKMKKF